MRVLVVEDQQVVRAKLAGMIRRMGHEVLEAADGEQGVATWSRERPDSVLMDAVMPVLDGYAAARRIRSLDPEGWTPIIFLSAGEADQDLEAAIDAGGDDYLVKPVSAVVLGAKIRAMQRLHEMRGRMRDMAHRLAEANRELARRMTLDGLTGVSNRRSLDEGLKREFRDARFADADLAVLMLDVDAFKAFNDSMGHQAGDECLRQVAHALDARRLGSEIVARYGGEEFAIVLPGADLAGAVARAEEVRAAVAALGMPHARSPVGPCVTVSVGVAALTARHTCPEDLVAEADRALYAAKAGGRNQVGTAAPRVAA